MIRGLLKITAGLTLNAVLFIATVLMISEITHILFGMRIINIIF
jgi:hypothetical protein